MFDSFQIYPVVEILNQFDYAVVKDPALVTKLWVGQAPTRQESMFLVNVLIEYLKVNAITRVYAFDYQRVDINTTQCAYIRRVWTPIAMLHVECQAMEVQKECYEWNSFNCK